MQPVMRITFMHPLLRWKFPLRSVVFHVTFSTLLLHLFFRIKDPLSVTISQAVLVERGRYFSLFLISNFGFRVSTQNERILKESKHFDQYNWRVEMRKSYEEEHKNLDIANWVTTRRQDHSTRTTTNRSQDEGWQVFG